MIDSITVIAKDYFTDHQTATSKVAVSTEMNKNLKIEVKK